MAVMSRLFILFLIALLPLRGWTSERMLMPAGSAASVQAHAHAMAADCALHMQMAPAAHDHAQGDASHGVQHKGCQNCQLCMPLAAMGCQAVLAGVQQSQTVLARPACTFASADAARHAKPPIS